MIEKARSLYMAVVLAWCALNTATAEELIVPLHEQERYPSVIGNGNIPNGIYPELFRMILERAEIKADYRVVPNMRRRIGFENERFLLSCCSNPVWRQRPKEKEVQLFSKTFHSSKDVFVFTKGSEFEITSLAVLSDKKVGAVHGFGYRGSEYFGERIDYKNEIALLKGLVHGRIDVGIVNQDVLNASEYAGVLSVWGLHDEASLHIRVHRSRADLLERVNQAIGEIIQDGSRDQILQKYMHPTH